MNFFKLDRKFYLRDSLLVSRDLIGKYIVHILDNEILAARITELECYKGDDFDKACHAYKGKRTKRTEPLFLEGGHLYIYLIYGMYYCMNVVTEKKESPAAILIRSVEVIKGIEKASYFRYNKKYSDLDNYRIKNFSNGPGKVCKCLNIDMKLNKEDLCGDKIFIAYRKNDIENKKYNIKVGKRINIDYAEEARDFFWRFYV